MDGSKIMIFLIIVSLDGWMDRVGMLVVKKKKLSGVSVPVYG
jgi:hypothetical protein